MGLFDRIADKLNPARMITDTVMDFAEGTADIVDRFVQNPEEKEAAKQALREYTLEKQKLAADKDSALLADRASARSMAGVHGKTQRQFSVIFMVAFFAVVLLDIGFIVFLVVLSTNRAGLDFPQWLTALIGTTLGSLTATMSAKLDEIIGFLFGGSASGDTASQQLGEAVQHAANREKDQ